jgi:hypothetical protein
VIELHLEDLRACFGLGVAGNFAGHLEQAGEAVDFRRVAASPLAPKGIFPWYAPGDESFLGGFPLSHDRIAEPAGSAGADLQLEPEAGVICRVSYGADGVVERLDPTALGAFNDCSIRREGAAKISEKKNWGADSKGVAPRGFEVTELDRDGATATFRLACFLRREGKLHSYGIDSPLPDYSYYGDQLLDWIVDRIRNQAGSADTPLEPVGKYLARAGNPELVLVGIGATRYTPFGASTYVRAGDQSIVVVYDAASHAPAEVESAIGEGRDQALEAASVLRQTVYDG